MVLIITTAWYPPGKANEAGKKFLEVFKKYPPDPSIDKTITLAVKMTKEDIKVIGISEVVKGKYEEALARITKSNQEYTSIEGFRYKMETFMDISEAMKIIGMKAPE